MTVIAGYLGAGKTTLVNRILAADHGLKLLIMVNDFGAINIDADLLSSRNEDTIALTNGCVCCTMGADLFLAIGDALERRPLPDHLIIEASGVADPSQIANAAIAEPDLRYAGIVTVVDSLMFDHLSADPLIGEQVIQQVKHADLIYVSKLSKGGLRPDLRGLTDAPILSEGGAIEVLDLLKDALPSPQQKSKTKSHPSYITWSSEQVLGLALDDLRSALAARPNGLFRLKGTIRLRDGSAWHVQAVGRQVELSRAEIGSNTTLVGIGLREALSVTDIETWWQSFLILP